MKLLQIQTNFRLCSWINKEIPTGTQLPDDVFLWSDFGRDVGEHNRIKVERIRLLTYFGSAISDIYLALAKIEKVI